MRVNTINNIQIRNTSVAKYSGISQCQSVNFRGIFNNKPSIQEYLRYGLEALDEQSLFIATNNKERTNYTLNQYRDKIQIPILRTYTLNITKDKCRDWYNEIDKNFAIFRKNEEYYLLSLGANFGIPVYKGKFDTDTSFVNPGETKKLISGEEIHVMGISSKEKLIFEKPRCFSNKNAVKYLDFKETIDINEHNTSAIQKLTREQKNNKNNKKYSFDDIGGLDNVIEELRKFVIRPINFPEVFENIRLNKGIILYGPPRCGKTLLGKALASEANIKYRYLNANEFKSGTVGESEKNVRQYFKEMMAEPSLLFIDEFDAIGKQRDGSHNARYDDALVNQILGCMSDLEKSDTTSFIIAATNRKDLLDVALKESGRFGLHLEIPLPNKEGLTQIFKIHSKKQNFAQDVTVEELVEEMFQNKFSGSDVAETISISYFNALDRLGLNKKMDAKTFSYEDLKSIHINKNDLLKAINQLAKQKTKNL